MISLFTIFAVLANPQIQLLGDKGVEITYTMEGLDSRAYIFDGASWLCNEGEPELPSLVYKIGVPQDGNVDVTVVDRKEKILYDISVKPVRYVGIPEAGQQDMTEIRSSVYEKNEFFPQSFVEITEPAYFRDIRTIDLRINPVQYNPVTKEMRIITAFTVRVYYAGNATNKQIIDDQFENIYNRKIINYGAVNLSVMAEMFLLEVHGSR
jgi:hypothetical protein